jgi:hypothetical protein
MFTPLPIFNSNPYASPFAAAYTQPILQKNTLNLPPEANLNIVVQYSADQSGCFTWRLGWPSHLLNVHQEMTIYDLSRMIPDPRFYQNVKCVRIQRQATQNQLEFVKFLKKMSEDNNFHLIYEIDDIIFHEDIPDYNKFKGAFANSDIRKYSQEIMLLCDEITCSCEYMKQYYASKTGHKNVTVIPNYPPRWWIGNFYDEKQISQKFDKNRNQPRILYPGSGAHFDVDSRVKQKDDFEHVNDAVIKTRKDFKWCFLGGFPLAVRPYIQSGEMEFYPWKNIYEYSLFIHSLNINAFVAPLQDNTFNKAKSDIKYVEASAFGLPIAAQDLETYKNAPYRFKTGDEMISILKSFFKHKDDYMKISRKARLFAETRFLENKENIGKYKELFLHRKGSPGRVLLK